VIGKMIGLVAGECSYPAPSSFLYIGGWVGGLTAGLEAFSESSDRSNPIATYPAFFPV
jgi:hypothetical protein